MSKPTFWDTHSCARDNLLPFQSLPSDVISTSHRSIYRLPEVTVLYPELDKPKPCLCFLLFNDSARDYHFQLTFWYPNNKGLHASQNSGQPFSKIKLWAWRPSSAAICWAWTRTTTTKSGGSICLSLCWASHCNGPGSTVRPRGPWLACSCFTRLRVKKSRSWGVPWSSGSVSAESKKHSRISAAGYTPSRRTAAVPTYLLAQSGNAESGVHLGWLTSCADKTLEIVFYMNPIIK